MLPSKVAAHSVGGEQPNSRSAGRSNTELNQEQGGGRRFIAPRRRHARRRPRQRPPRWPSGRRHLPQRGDPHLMLSIGTRNRTSSRSRSRRAVAEVGRAERDAGNCHRGRVRGQGRDPLAHVTIGSASAGTAFGAPAAYCDFGAIQAAARFLPAPRAPMLGPLAGVLPVWPGRSDTRVSDGGPRERVRPSGGHSAAAVAPHRRSHSVGSRAAKPRIFDSHHQHMLIYHRTHAAETIFRDGFHDTTGNDLATDEWRGVWVADRPLDSHPAGDVLLGLVVPDAESLPRTSRLGTGSRTGKH